MAGDSLELAFVPLFGDYHLFLNHSPIIAHILCQTHNIYNIHFLFDLKDNVCFHLYDQQSGIYGNPFLPPSKEIVSAILYNFTFIASLYLSVVSRAARLIVKTSQSRFKHLRDLIPE